MKLKNSDLYALIIILMVLFAFTLRICCIVHAECELRQNVQIQELNLEMLKQTNSSAADIQRAKEHLDNLRLDYIHVHSQFPNSVIFPKGGI